MKKLFIFFSLLLFCLLFTSCVDYVQTISFQDGNYKFYYKITVSKAILALADSDPYEIFFDFSEDELPHNGKIRVIDTDLEAGLEFSFDANPKTKDETEKSFLPTISGNKCFIPFLLGSENDVKEMARHDSDSEAIASAVFSSAKCRIIIEKNIIKEIETAYFEGKGGQDYSIPVFDYGSSYCIEIPFIVLANDLPLNLTRIIVIKK